MLLASSFILFYLAVIFFFFFFFSFFFRGWCCLLLLSLLFACLMSFRFYGNLWVNWFACELIDSVIYATVLLMFSLDMSVVLHKLIIFSSHISQQKHFMPILYDKSTIPQIWMCIVHTHSNWLSETCDISQICHKYECLLYIPILIFIHTHSSQVSDIRDMSQILSQTYCKYECSKYTANMNVPSVITKC